MRNNWKLYEGDCLARLKELPDDHVDLIVTSPPYGQQRKSSYGGITETEYVEWFIPRAEEMKRILKPTGSFILNIKESVRDFRRSTYVYDLVLSMIAHNWIWMDELVWHKQAAFPNITANRFRDSWERLYHFAKHRNIKIRKDNVLVSPSDSTIKQASAQRDAAIDGTLKEKSKLMAKTGSGLPAGQYSAKHLHEFFDRTGGKVHPPNVLFGPGDTGAGKHRVKHAATFPLWLPEWFIDAFTDPGDTILDPFCGSGTTMIAALNRDRKTIGIELSAEYCDTIRQRIAALPERLPYE